VNFSKKRELLPLNLYSVPEVYIMGTIWFPVLYLLLATSPLAELQGMYAILFYVKQFLQKKGSFFLYKCYHRNVIHCLNCSNNLIKKVCF